MDHTEDALLAYAVLSYPGIELGHIRPAMEQTAHLLQSLAGESDTIPANPDAPDLRFARTIGDVCPFLAAYAAAYGEPFYLNLAMRQLNEYLLDGMHPVKGLPAEGFDRGSGLPIGSFGWSKACAALAFGMMETARYLPSSDSRSVKLAVHAVSWRIVYALCVGGMGPSHVCPLPPCLIRSRGDSYRVCVGYLSKN